MKTKLFATFVASVLALSFLISGVSAATLAEWPLTSNGSAINVDADVTAGTYDSSGVVFNEFGADGANAEDWPTVNSPDDAKYFEVTIAPASGYTLTISDINFDYSASITGPAKFDLEYSTQSDFSSPTSITTESDVSSTEETSSNNVDIEVDEGETLTLRWFGYDFSADTNEFRIKDLSILGTVTEVSSSDNVPEDITELLNDADTIRNRGNNLDITIEDISTMGFGDDEDYWYPLDKVEIEFEVEYRGDEKFDGDFKWGIYNADDDKWIIDEKESIRIKDDDTETIVVSFTLDDPEDFKDVNDVVIYAWAVGEDKEYDDDLESFEYISQDINVINDDDFVALDDIEISQSTASCGAKNIQITADAWNIGDNDQDDVLVLIKNTELNLNKQIRFDEIKDFDSESVIAYFEVPANAQEKDYLISLEVFDEDEDIYETSEDDDPASYTIKFTVDGCTPAVTVPTALVTAQLKSGGNAGEPLAIDAVVTNTGSETSFFSISIEDFDGWATSESISPGFVNLPAGQSGIVSINLNVNPGVSGEQTFNIVLTSDTGQELRQPVQVSIAGDESADMFGGNIAVTILLALIGVLIVAILIVLIVRALR
jgi:hypothetical protein